MDDMKKVNRNYVFFLALMTALASSLFLLEFLLPKPFPFMKIGLSNIIVLSLVLSSYYKEALLVSVSKSFIGSFVTGTLFSPTFLLSFCGGVTSCIVMIVFSKVLRGVSVFGLSVIGAFVHLMSQLFLVRILLIREDSIFSLYPFLALSAIVTGLFTGILCYLFMQHIEIGRLYEKACV